MGILLTSEAHSLNPSHSKRTGREAIAIIICYLCALSFHFLHIDISGGILPKSISVLRFIGHHGFVCPLCGGMRSFFYFSAGALTDALHCSLLGTCVSAWLLLSLPIRILICLSPDNDRSKGLYRLIKRIEHPDVLIIAMACFMCIQLCLHYYLGFIWLPLQHLSEQ